MIQHRFNDYCVTINGCEYTNKLLSKNIINSEGHIDLVVEKIKSFNTQGFGVIVESSDKVILISDIIKSTPIFYKACGAFKYSFNLFELIDSANNKVNDDLMSLYSASGFLLDGSTLFDDVKLVPPATIITFDKITRETKFDNYFSFIPTNEISISNDDLKYQYRRALSPLKEIAKTRKIVIPLSGGSDSRAILEYCITNNIENVVCYTFGVAGNPEVKISERLAADAGAEWFFIEYSKSIWKKYKKDLNEFLAISSSASMMPHILDFIAVKELINIGVIDSNSTVVPGHSGDFIAGSHIYDEMNKLNENDIYDKIIEKNFNLRSNVNKNEILTTLKKWKCKNAHDLSLEQFYEFFDWKERQSMFIINSLKVYDYCNVDWFLPLWDKALVEFWSEVKREQRVSRNKYFDYERENINDKFPSLILNSESINNHKRSRISNVIPSEVARRLRAIIKDDYGYRNFVGNYSFFVRCLLGKTHFNSYVVDTVVKEFEKQIN
nr:hypothetical protein [uncultured Vibrio sp.]